MAVINSQSNFRVLQWCKLKTKAGRDKQGLFLVEGYHLVQEAHRASCLAELITTEKNRPFDVPTHHVTYEVMEKISAMATPAKVMGICRQPQAGAQVLDASGSGRVLLIDQITHPGNLGTIIRSAVAFGVDVMVLSKSVDEYNPKVIQATQGMIFHLRIIKRDIAEAIAQLKTQGYQIIGTDVREGQDLRTIQPSSPKHAIIMGSEGEGVGDALLKLCDVTVNIKMNPTCESLNVGVAASIMLFALGDRP